MEGDKIEGIKESCSVFQCDNTQINGNRRIKSFERTCNAIIRIAFVPVSVCG